MVSAVELSSTACSFSCAAAGSARHAVSLKTSNNANTVTPSNSPSSFFMEPSRSGLGRRVVSGPILRTGDGRGLARNYGSKKPAWVGHSLSDALDRDFDCDY